MNEIYSDAKIREEKENEIEEIAQFFRVFSLSLSLISRCV